MQDALQDQLAAPPVAQPGHGAPGQPVAPATKTLGRIFGDPRPDLFIEIGETRDSARAQRRHERAQHPARMQQAVERQRRRHPERDVEIPSLDILPIGRHRNIGRHDQIRDAAVLEPLADAINALPVVGKIGLIPRAGCVFDQLFHRNHRRGADHIRQGVFVERLRDEHVAIMAHQAGKTGRSHADGQAVARAEEFRVRRRRGHVAQDAGGECEIVECRSVAIAAEHVFRTALQVFPNTTRKQPSRGLFIIGNRVHPRHDSSFLRR